MKKAKIYGLGCAKCLQVEKVLQQASQQSGIDVELEKISDFQLMAEDGILSVPALAIDETIKSVGRIPMVAEVVAWLTE